MKGSRYRSLLSLLIVLCLGITSVVAAAPTTAGVSSAPADTSGPPPEEVSEYISTAKAAVAAENWTRALLITTRGLAWYPESADLLCLQGYTYRKTGQYGKAVDAVSRAIPLDPRPVRYADRGYAYLALGNTSAALADAEAGIALNASYPVSWGVKALALQGQGRTSEALEAVDQAIALTPDSAHYWHVKGRILAATNDCTGASAALEKSISLDAGYQLPYPGFGSAGENLASLNSTCIPGATASPQATAKSPMSLAAVVSIAGAVLVVRMRK